MNGSVAIGALDLERLAGTWYVVAHIPAKFERQATNAVISITPRDDRSIQINYRFAVGAPDGPRKLFRARGYTTDPENMSEWRVQPFWPFAWPVTWPCVVAHLYADYQSIIIGHPNWKYGWMLNRTPEMPEQAIVDLIALAGSLGCDPSSIRRVPQGQPPTGPADLSTQYDRVKPAKVRFFCRILRYS